MIRFRIKENPPMRRAWLGGFATWGFIGVFGYLIGVSFFEWAAAIGLAIWLIYQTVEFLAQDKFPDPDRPNSK
jgi:hypothetical protein